MIKLSKPMISEEEINAVSEVLRSGMLVQGKYVSNFERSISKYTNSEFSLAVSSGTASLHLALLAIDIKQGDAVFVPAFTFPATANVVESQGARSILVDVDIDTYNIDPIKLEEAIVNWKGKEVPKAIIVVHEFGAPCDMTSIMEIASKHNLKVIEDAACALGTRWMGKHVGLFGDIGCFSWHPRKAISTGEGGALTTNNENIYNKLNLLRNHGMVKKDDGKIDFLIPGYNYRLTEFQAVLGDMQLQKFNKWLEKRKELVKHYYDELKNKKVKLPVMLDGHAWQTFMILLEGSLDRNEIITKLKEKDIETNMGAQALHEMTYYKNKYGYTSEEFPNAYKLYTSGLALPLHQGINSDDVKYIVKSLELSMN